MAVYLIFDCDSNEEQEVPYLADDSLTVINNLSRFIFGLIRAIGMILLGFGIVQVGLSLKSHDPSQRANGFFNISRWCNHYICERNPESDYRLRRTGNKKKKMGRCRSERSHTVPVSGRCLERVR